MTQRFIIDLNLNIIEMDYDGSVELSYMEKERNGNKVKISIYVQDEENGIEKIELPNIEPYIGNGKKEEKNVGRSQDCGGGPTLGRDEIPLRWKFAARH